MCRKISVLTIIVVVTSLCLAQQVPSERASQPYRWDAASETLFFGVGLLERSSALPLLPYLNGVQSGDGIDLFKDVPKATKIVVFDAVKGIEGNIVVAAVINEGDKLKHVILTYDSKGALRSVWDTEPYLIQALAVDGQAYVYGLGNRLDDNFKGSVKPYPLLHRYGTDGAVLMSGLTSDKFLNGGKSIDPGSDLVSPVMSIINGKLFVFAPFENEVLVCGLDGSITKRARLQPLLSKLSKLRGSKHEGVRRVVFSGDYEVVIDLDEAMDSPTDRKHVAVVLDIGTMQHRKIVDGNVRTWQIVGTQRGRLLMLTQEEKGVKLTETALPN